MSRSIQFVCTIAPASLQTLAVILSKGIPRLRKTPEVEQAALWSPRSSKLLLHLHLLFDSGKGSRSLRSKRTLNSAAGTSKSDEAGMTVKMRPEYGPLCERSKACSESHIDGMRFSVRKWCSLAAAA